MSPQGDEKFSNNLLLAFDPTILIECALSLKEIVLCLEFSYTCMVLHSPMFGIFTTLLAFILYSN